MKKKEFAFIIVAGLMWGSSCLFIHALSPLGFSAGQMVSARGVVSFVAMALYALLFNRKSFRIKLSDLPLFCGMGVLLFATAYFYYLGMQRTSPSTAAVLMYMAPVYVLIFSVIFFHERFTPAKGISIFVMLVGCALVSGVVGGLAFDLVGMLFSFLSGVAYAAYSLLAKLLAQKKTSTVSLSIYSYLSMAIVSLFFAKPAQMAGLIAKEPAKSIPLLVGIGLVTFVIPYFLYTVSFRRLPAGTVSALAVVEPLAATLYSIFFLGERLTVASGIGVFLILGAIVALGIFTGREPTSTEN